MKRLLVALPFFVLAGIAPSLGSEAARAIGADGLAADLDGVGTAQAAFIRRSKLKRKRTAGYRVVVVVGDDVENNDVDSVDVTFDLAAGQPVPEGGTLSCDADDNCSTTVNLALKVVKPNGNKRFVFKDLDFSEDPDDFSYNTTTTLTDADGLAVGVPVTSTLEVEDDAGLAVRDATIRRVDATSFEVQVVVLGDFDDEVAEIYFSIDDYSGPDPEPDDSFVMSDPVVTGGTKVFTETIEFSDPDATPGEVYTSIIQFVDAEAVLGLVTVEDIVVGGLPAGGTPQGKFIKRFKGKTKFDRKMNETLTDQGKVTTNPGDTPVGMSIGMAYELLDSGLTLEGVGMVADRPQVRFDGAVTGDGPYELSVDHNGTVETLSIDDLVLGGVPQWNLSSGLIVGVGGTDSDGGVKVFVEHALPDWDPGLLEAVSVDDIALTEGTTRWNFEVFVDITDVPADVVLEGADTLVTATVYDADGDVTDSRAELTPMGEAESEDGARKLKVTETNRGHVKVVAYTRSSEGADSVDVDVIDDETGDTLVSASSATPAGVERQYLSSSLTFEDPASAVDEVYSLQLGAFADDGSGLGDASIEVIVAGIGASQASEFEVSIDGEPVAGVASITQLDETNFELSVSLLSDTVAQVEVEIGAQAGSAPIPEAVTLGMSAEWCKWIVKGSAGTGGLADGGSATVQLTVVDAEGAVRDVEGGLVDALPAVMFSFGKGTKNSTSAASAKPQLL